MRNSFSSKFRKIFFALAFLVSSFFAAPVFAQQIVDKTVALVSDGTTNPELITYSDLLWQMALNPDMPIDPPASEDLNRTLQVLIDIRLFALEAKRIPNVAPSEKEVKDEILRIVRLFPAESDFEKRLRLVGFDSIDDENFQKMMRQRVEIEKYLDFRFRSFVVITPDDEEKYYREVYTPEFRKTYPALLLPPLDDKRADINKTLVEKKIEENIEKFLEEAKRRNQILILSEV